MQEGGPRKAAPPFIAFSAEHSGHLWHIILWEAVELQHYLLLCRSITHAQRMSAALEYAGVRARISRPPVGLSEKGCSYAVRIGAGAYENAMRVLEAARLFPERVFIISTDGVYREIFQR